jgi:hypothetical protein
MDAKVTQEMNANLLKYFTREKVWDALKSIGNLKAVGPDDTPALFYKEFWDVVGEDVNTIILIVLGGGAMLSKLNDKAIVLVTKVRR